MRERIILITILLNITLIGKAVQDRTVEYDLTPSVSRRNLEELEVNFTLNNF